MTGGPYFNVKLRGANLESPAPASWTTTSNSNSTPNPIYSYKLSAFQMGQAHPFQVVFESERAVLQENNAPNSPKWKQSSISMEALCSGERDFPIMISVFDSSQEEGDTKNYIIPVLIGSCETTVSDLLRKTVGETDDVDVSKVFSLKYDSSHNRKETGLLVVVEASITDDMPQPDVVVEETTTNNNTAAATVASKDQNGTPTNDSTSNDSELEALRKALYKIDLKTDLLESETAGIRQENRRLHKKVSFLETTLMKNQTRMEEAWKEIAILKRQQKVSSLLDESLQADDSPAKANNKRNEHESSNGMDNIINSKMEKGSSKVDQNSSTMDGSVSRRHHHPHHTDSRRHGSSSKDRSRRRERTGGNEQNKTPDSPHRHDGDSTHKDRSKSRDNSPPRDISKERSASKPLSHSTSKDRSKTRGVSPHRGSLKQDSHSTHKH